MRTLHVARLQEYITPSCRCTQKSFACSQVARFLAVTQQRVHVSLPGQFVVPAAGLWCSRRQSGPGRLDWRCLRKDWTCPALGCTCMQRPPPGPVVLSPCKSLTLPLTVAPVVDSLPLSTVTPKSIVGISRAVEHTPTLFGLTSVQLVLGPVKIVLEHAACQGCSTLATAALAYLKTLGGGGKFVAIL